MEAGQFAEFLRVLGYRIVETDSCYWYSPKPFVFMSIPFHRIVAPSQREIATVLLRGPALAIRFPSAGHRARGQGGIFISSRPTYGLSSLQPRTRSMTRRGLENCMVERLPFTYLAEAGHPLVVKTLLRQGRDPHMISEQRWRRYCHAADKMPDFEAWGAFVRGNLAAFMVTALVENCFSILGQNSADEWLDYYPNNALVFTVTKHKLTQPEIALVSYGLKSLDDTPNLDRFKFHMGFELKPFTESMVFNPLLKLWLSIGGGNVIEWMARRNPQSDLWRKASNVVRLAKE